ncbi:ABC transporter ATP-binding protein [Mycolicibacterium brisbanense]|uniref:ABC transporter n=1 Tax=Mycolicibacterium brisbanense TaxID=146020 RepID=A0A124E024_9MYCO|nr:ABC transporter ATP-binding protein [Mycolicibacterium brisbanense]MCV7156382.1 ABC transporter ATP-binding protein [Mycolicibacterium brisbanense]GAS89193.1 ABC transporter [Mycolicibacterium brisbanense]
MAIQTHDLVVQFPGQREPTLKNISVTVPDGSFAVLVGASGSGKSTLLHCLAGLIAPTSGTVTDNGEPVTEPHPRRGVAFQRDVLFPWMTVADNIDFALTARYLAKTERQEQIRILLDLVGLRADVARQRPTELSGGMRQRVSIARVLAGEPSVMLMDEPFAALDALTRLRMQDLLIDLWTRLNRTIVFVTHDIDEAIRLGDTVSVLRDGRIADHIVNPLSRPRPADALADQPGYSEIRKTLHRQLEEART